VILYLYFAHAHKPLKLKAIQAQKSCKLPVPVMDLIGWEFQWATVVRSSRRLMLVFFFCGSG
jgi:hypothetical protein